MSLLEQWKIKSIKDFDLKDQRVFLRLDLNTPLKDGEVSDDTRIRAAIPTIKYAMEAGAKVVLASHLGRPKTDEDRKKLSMEPVAKRLGELLSAEVILIEDPLSDAPKGLLSGLKKDQVILLENLRFDAGETKNATSLSQAVSDYAQIYINDAFGASHREHASIHSLAKSFEQRGVGLLVEKEIHMLSKIIEAPERPYVAIMGGSKVSDKIELIEKIIDQVDVFIIGGAMAYTFLKARHISVGTSRVEEEKLSFARDLMGRLEARDKTLLLPVDHVIGETFADPQDVKTISTESIPEGYLAMDIGPETRKRFCEAVKSAKTVFWNGPMGVFEKEQFRAGSMELAKALAESSAETIVGGGDSAAAAQMSGYADQMSHISTGGGASLEFLQNPLLPGFAALRPLKTSEGQL